MYVQRYREEVLRVQNMGSNVTMNMDFTDGMGTPDPQPRKFTVCIKLASDDNI